MKKLKDLRLQTKLILSIGPAIFLGAVITAWALVIINRMDDQASFLIQSEGEVARIHDAQNQIYRMQLASLDYVLVEDETYTAEHNLLLDSVKTGIQNALVVNEYFTSDPFLETTLLQVQDMAADYELSWGDVKDADSIDTKIDRVLTLYDLSDEMWVALEDVYMFHDDAVIATQDAIFRQVDLLLVGGSIGIVVFIAVMVLTVLLVRRQLVVPLIWLTNAAETFGQDKLDVTKTTELAKRSDEVGYLARTFLEMVEEIREEEQILKDEAAELRKKLSNLEN